MIACNFQCENCENKDICLKCRYPEAIPPSCICKEGYFYNRSLLCESTNFLIFNLGCNDLCEKCADRKEFCVLCKNTSLIPPSCIDNNI